MIEALAKFAAAGAHGADERPFLTPWAEGEPRDRARSFVQEHWYQLSSWTPDNRRLGLAVFDQAEQPLIIATLRARDFRVTREVTTSSWLGLSHQGQGYGTEARIALLTLAFDHLGATDATTEVIQDNHRSHSVSRKLGYQHDGISRDRRGDEIFTSDRLRLTGGPPTRGTCAVEAHGLQAAHVPVTTRPLLPHVGRSE